MRLFKRGIKERKTQHNCLEFCLPRLQINSESENLAEMHPEFAGLDVIMFTTWCSFPHCVTCSASAFVKTVNIGHQVSFNHLADLYVLHCSLLMFQSEAHCSFIIFVHLLSATMKTLIRSHVFLSLARRIQVYPCSLQRLTHLRQWRLAATCEVSDMRPAVTFKCRRMSHLSPTSSPLKRPFFFRPNLPF